MVPQKNAPARAPEPLAPARCDDPGNRSAPRMTAT